MKNKISAQLAKELEEFRGYIRSSDESHTQKNQEYFLATLALLLNPLFRNTIQEWRKIYKIPDFSNQKLGSLSSHIEWAMTQHSNPPYEDTDERVYSLCRACHLSPKLYGNFIIDYLYFGFSIPFRPEKFNPFGFDPHYRAEDEFRFKSRIELDYGMPRKDEYTEEPQKAFIRIFGNTSQKNLINFIKKNWVDISKVKKNLKPYPHEKKFKKFKRDMQIYLLYLLGKKVEDIAETIYSENIPEDVIPTVQKRLEEEYDLENNRVYEVITDIENHIKNINE